MAGPFAQDLMRLDRVWDGVVVSQGLLGPTGILSGSVMELLGGLFPYDVASHRLAGKQRWEPSRELVTAALCL